MKLLVRISASRAGRSARRGRWWTMSKAKHRYEIEGRGWLIASRAAALLGTNAAGIRKLMGDGTLEWRQARTNSSVLVVDERQVFDLRTERPSWTKEGAFKPVQRVRPRKDPPPSGKGYCVFERKRIPTGETGPHT